MDGRCILQVRNSDELNNLLVEAESKNETASSGVMCHVSYFVNYDLTVKFI